MRAVLPQAIQITLLPSYLILGLLGGVSIACCLILLSLPILFIIRLVIIALIFASSGYFIARDAMLLLPSSWQMLEVDIKGELTLTNKRGQTFQPRLAASSFIHAKLVILNFQRESFKLALPSVIFVLNQQDTKHKIEEIRRLRVYLRWFKHDMTQELA